MNERRGATGPIVILEPDSKLRQPRALAAKMVAELQVSRHLALEMFRRDLTSQIRQSFMGIFQVFVPSLVTTGWAVLFRQASIINVGEIELPYPFYVLLGMMIWSTFTEAIDAPISGLLSEQGLISKSNTPPETVAIARLLMVSFNLLLKLVVIAAVAVCYGIAPRWSVVLVPFGLGAVMACGAGIGLILSPINMLYRDIARTLPVVLTLMFFLTPILFVLPKESIAAFIMLHLNPVTSLLIATRDVAFSGPQVFDIGFASSVGISILVFCLGLVFHRVATPIVIDRGNA